MPEQLIEAAHAYALHAITCEKCSNACCDICEEGLRLLHEFHVSLRALQQRQTAKGDFDA